MTEALACGVPVVATPTAAREQPAHPLLAIAEGTVALAERVTMVLRKNAEPDFAGAPPLRTWDVVAEEYLAECRAALDAARGG